MASRKNIWDTLDSLEGKKDSSHDNLQKELKRQGYNKNHFESKGAKSKALGKKTGLHKMTLKEARFDASSQARKSLKGNPKRLREELDFIKNT